MRRLLPCLCLVILFGSTAFAQDREYPKVDFTAAFTLNHFETPAPVTHPNLYGFTGAIGGNIKKWFAVEGDITYTTKTVAGTSRNLLTYLVGPRFTKRISSGGGTRHNHASMYYVPGAEKSKFEPFVHVLIGGGHLSGFGASTNGWAGKFGGGLDIVAGKHVAIRVVQIDYYRYHGHLPVGLPTQRLDNVALTFGIRVF